MKAESNGQVAIPIGQRLIVRNSSVSGKVCLRVYTSVQMYARAHEFLWRYMSTVCNAGVSTQGPRVENLGVNIMRCTSRLA